MRIYIGLDGHVYIRLYSQVVWRSSERVDEKVIAIHRVMGGKWVGFNG